MNENHVKTVVTEAVEKELWGKQSITEPKLTIPPFNNKKSKEENIIDLVFFVREYFKNQISLGDEARKIARIAKELYRSGLTTEEIAKRLNKHPTRIRQYYMHMGGLTPEDKALHMQNRYLKD